MGAKTCAVERRRLALPLTPSPTAVWTLPWQARNRWEVPVTYGAVLGRMQRHLMPLDETIPRR
jgi:hypothetical protein